MELTEGGVRRGGVMPKPTIERPDIVPISQKKSMIKKGYQPLPKDKPLHNGWQPDPKNPSNIVVPPDPPKKQIKGNKINWKFKKDAVPQGSSDALDLLDSFEKSLEANDLLNEF